MPRQTNSKAALEASCRQFMPKTSLLGENIVQIKITSERFAKKLTWLPHWIQMLDLKLSRMDSNIPSAKLKRMFSSLRFSKLLGTHQRER